MKLSGFFLCGVTVKIPPCYEVVISNQAEKFYNMKKDEIKMKNS